MLHEFMFSISCNILKSCTLHFMPKYYFFIFKEYEAKVYSFQFICQNKSYKLILSHEFLQLRLRKVTVKPK